MSYEQGLQPPHDPVVCRIRNLVIDRLLRMNARHATHAWLQRRAQPVGPHGLAFLYCDQPTPGTVGEPGTGTVGRHGQPQSEAHGVAAATRLVNDGADVRNLPRLLYRLSTLVRERYLSAGGGFDPRAYLANRQDRMSAHATYIGIGVSSLDTAAGTWDDIQRAAAGPLDLPGRCFALLTDGTELLLERGGQDVYGQVRILSTRDLNVEPGIASRRWAWRADLHTLPGTREIWRRLYDLHELAARQRHTPRSS
jgi:hypothetical protein